MPNSEFALTLVPSAQERLRDEDVQLELRRFELALTDIGLKASSVVELQESEGGGWHYGEFFVQMTQSAAALMGVVIGGWLNSRAGRKVRVKVGDIEAEAATVQDALELLGRAYELKQKSDRKVIP